MTGSRTVLVIVLAWLLTRAAAVALLVGPESWVTGDVGYFAASLRAVPDVGLARTLVEYPLPGVVLVAVPWLVSELLDRPDQVDTVLACLALATDAAYTWSLVRFGHRPQGVWVWLLGAPLLGATAYARFDLVPGALAGAAVLVLATHPRVAAGAAALATSVKLWPALLLPALAARSATRRPVVVLLVGTGLTLVGACVALAGWERLVSPLVWQRERGLQVEAVLATPAMLGWAFGPGELVVGYSEFNAFEVSGPGVSALLTAGAVLTVVAALAMAVLWTCAWRMGDALRTDAVSWLCLAAVTAFLVTGKVLSPQYLLWLLPLAAAGLALAETPESARRLTRWSLLLLAATAMTHLVFPLLYGGISVHQPWSPGVVLVLAGRNVILVWLLATAVVEAWRQVRPAQRGIALERHPPGPWANDGRTLR